MGDKNILTRTQLSPGRGHFLSLHQHFQQFFQQFSSSAVLPAAVSDCHDKHVFAAIPCTALQRSGRYKRGKLQGHGHNGPSQIIDVRWAGEPAGGGEISCTSD